MEVSTGVDRAINRSRPLAPLNLVDRLFSPARIDLDVRGCQAQIFWDLAGNVRTALGADGGLQLFDLRPGRGGAMAQGGQQLVAGQLVDKGERDLERINHRLELPPVLAEEPLELRFSLRSDGIRGSRRTPAYLVGINRPDKPFLGHLIQREVDGAIGNVGPPFRLPGLLQLATHVVTMD